MKIGTLSVVIGGSACNARCPFCVSKMTPPNGVTPQAPPVKWRNIMKAARLAQIHAVSTVLLTGKGEPTLWPDRISETLSVLAPYEFPLTELQTNATLFTRQRSKFERLLSEWYEAGLSTVAVSIVDVDPQENRMVYLPHADSYPDLAETVQMIHDAGLSVRFSVVMLDGVVDSPEALCRVTSFASAHAVEQVTFRPVRMSVDPQNPQVGLWAGSHAVSDDKLAVLTEFVTSKGTKLMELPHGAVVFDVDGQNVCLSDCLTLKPDTDDLRQLIVFPDGHIRYDWQFEGAVIL